MKTIITATLIILGIQLRAQNAASELWAQTYQIQTNTYNYINAIVTDVSGNVYVTGSIDANVSHKDIITIKYNSSGVQQWAQRYNGSASLDDWGYAIAVDAGGNVYITGTATNSHTYSGYATSDIDYITIKYNSSGTQQWASIYNGTNTNQNAYDHYDLANGIRIDASGNVYVTGSSTGLRTAGPVLGASPVSDFATVKYSNNGTQLWVSRYNKDPYSSNEAADLQVDASGNVYVTGSSYTAVGWGSSYISSDYSTVKYNSTGTQQWAVNYNGTANGDDLPSALVIDGSGNIYVAGTSPRLSGGTDLLTLKYNNSGTQQWVTTYNGTGNRDDRSSALAIDASNNIYVIGTANLDISGENGDYITLKYNNAGVQQWAAVYNGEGNGSDVACSIALDASNNIYITGNTRGTSYNNIGTIKYDNSGVQQWVALKDNGSACFVNEQYATAKLALDASANVYVGGRNLVNLGQCLTLKYGQITLSLTTGLISNPLCQGGTINVPFTATGSPNSGNIFTAQLSNSTGSFSSPTNVGNLTSTTSGIISATIPGGTLAGSGYRIRVVCNNSPVTGIDNGSNLSVQPCSGFTWTGAVSSSWTTVGNWSGLAIPGSTDNIIIPTGVSNYPYLTGNLTHSAGITIESGASLKIDGILTNNGTITINSGGSLVQTSASTLSGTGTFNVKRAIPGLTSFISSPVNNEPVNGFGITTTGTNGGQIKPSISNPCNPISVDASSPYGNLLELRENPAIVFNNCAQSLWFVKSAGIMTNGRGYSLRNAATTLNFSGMVNNGTVTYSGLTRQSGTINDGDGSVPTRGWHLVGNPYPSPITLHSGDLGAGFDNQVAFYNSGTWVSYSLSVTPVTVAVGQGFQIRNSTAGTNPNFSLTNSLRTAANPTFYSQGLLIDHYLIVYLNNGTQSDKTMVYFMDDATNDFDPQFDANRMSDDIDRPMVYTMTGTQRLSYNALPTMNPGESSSVPLGIRTEVPGNHTLTFRDLPTLETTSVSLEDLKLNTTQQITEGFVYNFTTAAGDSRDRFVLHFSADISSGIISADKAVIPVYSFGNRVYINMKDLDTKEIVTAVAYDLAGRLLFEQQIKGGSLFMKEMESIGTDLIVVQLRNTKGETSRTKLFMTEKK